VGLFKPYDEDSSASTTPSSTSSANTGESQGPAAPTKKKIPTPTRRQAEQARRDRIRPVLTPKQAREKERENKYKSRDEQNAKLNAHPYNVLIRDWIDHRWNMAEFLLPVILLIFVGTIVGGYFAPFVMSVASYVIWAVFALLFLDTVYMWFKLRQHLRTHFPDEPMKGKFSYAFSRSMQMRRSRIPAPRVKRGSTFTWPYEGDES